MTSYSQKKEFYNICSKLINKSNFIHLYNEFCTFSLKDDDTNFIEYGSVTHYLNQRKNEHELIGNSNFLLKIKRSFSFSLFKLHIKDLVRLFMFFKEYHYFINGIYIPEEEWMKDKTFLMYLETNLDCKYRYKEDPYYISMIRMKKNRKNKKYLNQHNIYNHCYGNF